MGFSKEEQMIMNAVGIVLRTMRKKKNYTSAEDFSTDISMDKAVYGRYERGENMKLISLNRLLSHHDIKICDFFPRVKKVIAQLESKKKK